MAEKKPFGYLSGLGLLILANLLFIGLILCLLLQPRLTSTLFAHEDLAIFVVMTLVYSMPLILFI